MFICINNNRNIINSVVTELGGDCCNNMNSDDDNNMNSDEEDEDEEPEEIIIRRINLGNRNYFIELNGTRSDGNRVYNFYHPDRPLIGVYNSNTRRLIYKNNPDDDQFKSDDYYGYDQFDENGKLISNYR